LICAKLDAPIMIASPCSLSYKIKTKLPDNISVDLPLESTMVVHPSKRDLPFYQDYITCGRKQDPDLADRKTMFLRDGLNKPQSTKVLVIPVSFSEHSMRLT